jgi:short-subunit dehydrogenase
VEVRDQVAIVTGSSSGIGLSVARKWVAAGGKVALVARRKALLDEHVRDLGADRAAAFALDVTDLDALAGLPAKVVSHFGALHAVVNNAGLNHRGPITKHAPRALADIITTNLTAPIVLTRAAVDHLRPGGAIVNVASLAGFIPFADEATYCASKAGLRAFTRAVRDEHPELRIGVVSPGPVDTDFFGEIEEVPDLVFSQPMSSPDQVADAVLACMAENAPEIPLPRLSGALATVGYVFPALARRLRPMLAKRGAINKAKHLARKRV